MSKKTNHKGRITKKDKNSKVCHFNVKANNTELPKTDKIFPMVINDIYSNYRKIAFVVAGNPHMHLLNIYISF